MLIRNARPNPSSHPFEVGRVRTMELILSVTVANVCPGSITGACVVGSSTVYVPCHPERASAREGSMHLHPEPGQPSISEFGFRISARYVVLGRVFRSANNP